MLNTVTKSRNLLIKQKKSIYNNDHAHSKIWLKNVENDCKKDISGGIEKKFLKKIEEELKDGIMKEVNY